MAKKDSKSALANFKKDFLAFAMKGNVVDMAVGVVIGGAFGKIVTSLVNDIIFPLLSPLTGKLDYTNLFIAMDGQKYATLDAAKEAGVATLNYGSFISLIVNFLIVALSIFLIVRLMAKLRDVRKKEEAPAAPAAPTTKECPHCFSEIKLEATRCPHCTSVLEE